MTIARRLQAPAPGWTESADVIVVGSGIAGLTTAVYARQAGLNVLLVTKAQVDEGSTRWAQGGIAAALSEEDSPAEHLQDTLVAGAGICDVEAVEVLVTEGPLAVQRLIDWGAQFDKTASGEIALTREGGHLRDRIAHAGGDATGAEITRALVAEVLRDPHITLVEQALVLDLLTDASGAAAGVTLHVMGQGQRDGVGAALAPAIVLATGGIGQVYTASTNPTVATGDGLALGLRAGAVIGDVEFVQFHPTVLYLGAESMGQQPLISEAVRGEGASLVDDSGKRFMVGQHELAELAPRDVVAKAIKRQMIAQGSEHVWLDARHLGPEFWAERFPSILSSCRAHGIEPSRDLIPVAPAQHYHSGGLRTDTYGRTSIPGLFACGEVSCTGVHGANRLASNSLLEGLVFAERIGQVLAQGVGPPREPVDLDGPAGLLPAEDRAKIQQTMTDDVGVLRDEESLSHAAKQLDDWAQTSGVDARTATWETTNIHAAARVITHHALLREETRGSHWREDFPERDDEHWRVRQLTRLNPDGELETWTEEP